MQKYAFFLDCAIKYVLLHKNCLVFKKKMRFFTLLALSAVLFLSCNDGHQDKVIAPWGEVGGNDSLWADDRFDLEQIQRGGELIMLTVSGPET